MFDLITGTATHIPRHPRGPLLVSTGIQLTLMGLVVLVPVLLVTHALPQPPTMMAFVAARVLASWGISAARRARFPSPVCL